MCIRDRRNTSTIAGRTIIFCRLSRSAGVSGVRSFFGFSFGGAALLSVFVSIFCCSIYIRCYVRVTFRFHGQFHPSGMTCSHFPAVVSADVMDGFCEGVQCQYRKNGKHGQYYPSSCFLGQAVRIPFQLSNNPFPPVMEFPEYAPHPFSDILHSHALLPFDGLQILVLDDGKSLDGKPVRIVVRA